MNNVKYNSQATKHKVAITNSLFSLHSQESKFFIAMLNGTAKGTKDYSRAANLGAHFIVETVMNKQTFWERYYMTFNCTYSMKLSKWTFTIRKDYIDYVKESGMDTNNLYFLAIDGFDHKIYRIKFDVVVSRLNDKATVYLNDSVSYDCYVIDCSLGEELTYDDKEIDFKKHYSLYKYDYFKPQYISNFSYSEFRKSTEVRTIVYNAKTGKKSQDITFRSISEAFTKLGDRGIVTVSKATFARHIAKQDSIRYADDDNKFVVIVTTNISSDVPDEIDPVVKIETTDDEVLGEIEKSVESYHYDGDITIYDDVKVIQEPEQFTEDELVNKVYLAVPNFDLSLVTPAHASKQLEEIAKEAEKHKQYLELVGRKAEQLF